MGRSCPYGLVPTASAHATNADKTLSPFASEPGAGAGMHTYMECSNSGVCDRPIGTCQCNDDREGAACDRNKCPNGCSFNGLCRTKAKVAGELVDLASLHGATVDWNTETCVRQLMIPPSHVPPLRLP